MPQVPRELSPNGPGIPGAKATPSAWKILGKVQPKCLQSQKPSLPHQPYPSCLPRDTPGTPSLPPVLCHRRGGHRVTLAPTATLPAALPLPGHLSSMQHALSPWPDTPCSLPAAARHEQSSLSPLACHHQPGFKPGGTQPLTWLSPYKDSRGSRVPDQTHLPGRQGAMCCLRNLLLLHHSPQQGIWQHHSNNLPCPINLRDSEESQLAACPPEVNINSSQHQTPCP